MRFLPLLFTVFIDSLGFGLIFPILSPMIMTETSAFLPADTTLELRGFLFGTVIASFCLGQFFGSPILGGISDRKGRKKVLSFTLWLAFFSYLLGGFSVINGSFVGLLLSRVLSGVAAGNYSVAQSVVVDLSEEKEKSKNFALLGMAWGVGFILGPYLGGVFSDGTLCSFFSWPTPFWVAALLCFLNLCLVLGFLKESLATPSDEKLKFLSGFLHIRKACSLPKLRGIFLVIFIFAFGWGFFTEFSPVFLIRHLDANVKEISLFYAYVGLCIAICQGILIRPFVKRFSPQRLLAVSLCLLGFVLLGMLFVQTTQQLHFLLPFIAFFDALFFPSAATLISNLAEKKMQGEVLGIYNSIQWAAIGFPPLVAGSLVAQHPHLPVTVASVCMFAGCALFIWIYKTQKEIFAPESQI